MFGIVQEKRLEIVEISVKNESKFVEFKIFFNKEEKISYMSNMYAGGFKKIFENKFGINLGNELYKKIQFATLEYIKFPENKNHLLIKVGYPKSPYKGDFQAFDELLMELQKLENPLNKVEYFMDTWKLANKFSLDNYIHRKIKNEQRFLEIISSMQLPLLHIKNNTIYAINNKNHSVIYSLDITNYTNPNEYFYNKLQEII